MTLANCKCLFCQGDAVIDAYYPRQKHTEYYVLCRNPQCQARGPWRFTPEEALTAWSPPIAEQLAELEHDD